jgi:hypothetical protein
MVDEHLVHVAEVAVVRVGAEVAAQRPSSESTGRRRT